MIKLKDILKEEPYKSGKLFVMKSPYAPKHMPYDHIGFITDDGDIIDMSGHRYTKDGKKPLPPKKYKYEDTEDLFKMPKNKEEAIKKGLYKEIPLPKGVEVPSKTPTCSTDKNKAENCGSFVKIVLSNNGIETTKSNDMTDIASAVANKTEAGKKSFKDPRSKAQPVKSKSEKRAKTGDWWNTASDARKKSYIKKFGGPPNESIIKLTSLLSEGKTVSIFDFDDTIAQSDSWVYIKKGGRVIKKLDPAEFAVYTLKSDEEYDFSDFDRKIRNPRLIKKNAELLKKQLKKGGRKVTILTARRLKAPINHFFKTIGIQPYVVTLGDANPQKKADYIENEIKKGYTTIYFMDDSIKNIRAVDALKRKYPKVKLITKLA